MNFLVCWRSLTESSWCDKPVIFSEQAGFNWLSHLFSTFKSSHFRNFSTSPLQKKSVWLQHISCHFPITKIKKKIIEKGVWGGSFIIKRSFKMMKCLNKIKGIHINHFIYKLVNKDISKYKLSKTGILSDLWQCCNTDAPLYFSPYLKRNSVLLCE